MEYLTFDKIYEKYSEEVRAKSDAGHKVGQVREKFTEIADAVGIDKNLFRTYCGCDGEPVIKNVNPQTPLQFPETSVDFVMTILKNHGDRDYKELRRGNFDDVDLEVLEFLLKGFTEFVKNLGYDKNIILRENYNMRKRMRMTWHRSRDELILQCAKLIADAEDYNNTLVNWNQDDTSVFVPYMTQRVKNLRENISFIHSTYTDIRGDELSELALEETAKKSDSESMEKMYMELQLGHELMNDEKYQSLVKKRDELIASYDFVKNKKSAYDTINKKISDIYEKHRQKIFGDTVEEDDESEMNLKSPYEVLLEAIEYVEECDAEDSKREIKELSQTEEEKAEIDKAFEEVMKKYEIERQNRLNEEKARTKKYAKMLHS